MLRAGFDYSWSEASFALAEEDGTVLFDKCIALPPRNASGLPAWMEECLARQRPLPRRFDCRGDGGDSRNDGTTHSCAVRRQA